MQVIFPFENTTYKNDSSELVSKHLNRTVKCYQYLDGYFEKSKDIGPSRLGPF